MSLSYFPFAIYFFLSFFHLPLWPVYLVNRISTFTDSTPHVNRLKLKIDRFNIWVSLQEYIRMIEVKKKSGVLGSFVGLLLVKICSQNVNFVWRDDLKCETIKQIYSHCSSRTCLHNISIDICVSCPLFFFLLLCLSHFVCVCVRCT